jgi:hypothetical protein
MNRGRLENDFRRGVETLLAAMERETAPNTPSPYVGAGEQILHEHDTRIYFFDRLLALLGWELGPAGNVAEEARIKADTTKFVDYVGVNPDTRAPALILEVKSWDKPFVTGRDKACGLPGADLIVAAIKHLRAGGTKAKSPVAGDWHDYLDQVSGYVHTFRDRYGHSVPCAVLASGQWIVVFKAPVSIFCDDEVNYAQFEIFELPDYAAKAHRLFELLARSVLAGSAPPRIRSAQLANYVRPGDIAATYHAVLVKYERTGAAFLTQLPRILVYPAILVERSDQNFFTVIDAELPTVMKLSPDAAGEDDLAEHVAEVAAQADTLLQRCSNELGIALVPRDLAAFPGFPKTAELEIKQGMGLPLEREGKIVVRLVRGAGDHWLAVTGSAQHYLRARPIVDCRFHAWAQCRAEGHQSGSNAINSPATESPRAFFVDTRLHHCAHQIVLDRRARRCHIDAIDARTCCRACAYQNLCWPAQELAALPCGK